MREWLASEAVYYKEKMVDSSKLPPFPGKAYAEDLFHPICFFQVLSLYLSIMYQCPTETHPIITSYRDFLSHYQYFPSHDLSAI